MGKCFHFGGDVGIRAARVLRGMLYDSSMAVIFHRSQINSNSSVLSAS